MDVADRLRELIDLVLGSIDEPGADGRALARRANFSRDNLDRLLAAATGETPAALRRSPCPTTSLKTLPGAAPNAIRRPISDVRCRTTVDNTP